MNLKILKNIILNYYQMILLKVKFLKHLILWYLLEWLILKLRYINPILNKWIKFNKKHINFFMIILHI